MLNKEHRRTSHRGIFRAAHSAEQADTDLATYTGNRQIQAVAVTSDRAACYKDFRTAQLHVVVNLAPIYKQVGRYVCPNCSS